MVGPQAKKRAMFGMLKRHPISQRRICQLLSLHRSVGRYQSKKQDQAAKERILKHAHARKRFGYRRIHLLLRAEGLKINHKRVYRIYKELGLKVMKRSGRKKAVGTRGVLDKPLAPNVK